MTPASRNAAEDAAARIGERVSAVRTAQNVRVSELARRIGVSSSLISQIERGHSRPSVATLFALARALEVAVDTFFVDPGVATNSPAASAGNGVAQGTAPPPAAASGTAPAVGAEQAPRLRAPELAAPSPASRRRGDRHVVRQEDRAAIDIRGGVRWERLTPTALDGVEFLELVYAPGAESDPQPYRHPGIELVLVTRGVMTIFLGFDRHELHPGDSIAFPSSTPHRYANLTDDETHAVTVILADDLSTLSRYDDHASEPEDGDLGDQVPE